MDKESRTEKLAQTNYWDEILRLRDEERGRNKEAVAIVKGKELPWEVNKQGVMQWYLHPCIFDTIIKPFIFYVQKIPPGSRSGRDEGRGEGREHQHHPAVHAEHADKSHLGVSGQLPMQLEQSSPFSTQNP